MSLAGPKGAGKSNIFAIRYLGRAWLPSIFRYPFVVMKVLAPVLFASLLTITSADAAQTSLTAQAQERTSRPFQDPVLVVDAAGMGDYQDLQAAVSSATPETLILVRSGTYSGPVVVDGKGLKIFADAGATVTLTERLTVKNLAATERMTLSGFVLLLGFRIEQCAGSVLFQDCTTPQGGPALFPDSGLPYYQYHFCGVGGSRQVIDQSQAVTLVNCELFGSDNSSWGWDGSPGSHGLRVVDSRVALYGCRLVGSNGDDCFLPPTFPVGGGSGGDGLQVEGTTSWVWMTRTSAEGGAGGLYSLNSEGILSRACDGSPVRSLGGATVVSNAHPDLAYQVPTVLRGGQLGWHDVQGPSGTYFVVGRSRSRDWLTLSAAEGIQHLGRYQPSAVGTLLADGSLRRPFLVQRPPDLRTSIAVEMQGYTDTGGAPFWSEPRLLVIVHPNL